MSAGFSSVYIFCIFQYFYKEHSDFQEEKILRKYYVRKVNNKMQYPFYALYTLNIIQIYQRFTNVEGTSSHHLDHTLSSYYYSLIISERH